MAKTVNQTVLDLNVRHQVYLTRYSTSLVRKISDVLTDVEQDVIAQLIKRGNDGTFTQKRLQALLDSIRDINADAHRQIQTDLGGELYGLGKYEADFQSAILKQALPVAFDVVTPSAQILKAVVSAKPFQGRLLKDWVADMNYNSRRRLQAAIRIGVVEGETIDQMVRRIRGTAALKFKDGIISTNKRGAEAMVRTAVNHTATYAREALYEENPDLVKAVRWVSVLDHRTTAICRARDGKIYKAGQGPRPPAHIGCRSTTAPVVASWRELGIDIDEAPVGTRSSMNGQVPASQTYPEWLKTQPREFVEDVLGKSKAKLFLEGNLKIERFVDMGTGREYTLEELKRREAAAWKRAGLAA